jgi:hypothetical protein
MDAMSSIVARAAVANYRREPMAFHDPESEIILQRLEADPDGKVSAALIRLKLHQSSVLVFYVVQAAHLAQSADSIVRHSHEKMRSYRNAADTGKHLTEFCKGNAPIELVAALERLVEFLDQEANRAAATPAQLQIVRTKSTPAAPAMLALRHLGRKLRDEFGIKHPSHDGVRWLIEAALALNHDIPHDMVADALRGRLGIGIARKRRQLPIRRNVLKKRGFIIST